jgi:hypothetical protein
VITFLFYITAMLLVFMVCAIIADLWLAHDERKARAAARAKLREERER